MTIEFLTPLAISHIVKKRMNRPGYGESLAFRDACTIERFAA